MVCRVSYALASSSVLVSGKKHRGSRQSRIWRSWNVVEKNLSSSSLQRKGFDHIHSSW
ncbi:hypothetical protein CRG98_016266 [Punica granatum]|uniref:Uncharacterized protein n=1 Tax=Punica granatum TaxID=22663 RepID=A0A2I0K496_PUNGR|nr:hypothetical protein CRG98_016266 [Punica granatum]